MPERYDYDLDETLNLYLDGRLSGKRLEEFERRMATDPPLRRAVEFHRGLTLDFREETPPLPRGYAQRARARLRAAEAGEDRSGRLAWFRRAGTLRLLATAVAAVAVAFVLWPVARRGLAPQQEVRPLSGYASGDRALDEPAARPQAMPEPDEETLEALRSLGYIASGTKEAAPVPDAKTRSAGPDRAAPEKARKVAGDRDAAPVDRQEAADVAADRSMSVPAAESKPVAEAGEGGARARQSARESATLKREALAGPGFLDAEPDATADPGDRRDDAAPAPAEAAPSATGAPAAGAPLSDAQPAESLPIQVLGIPRAPEPEGGHRVIESAETWGSLFRGTGAEPPAIDFNRERLVWLPDRFESDPPARLRVVSILREGGSLIITARVERAEEGGDAEIPAGQVVLVPADGRTIRVVVEP